MKVLVTGGFGFIGSHLVEALIHQGHAVTVIDNMSTGGENNLEHVRGQYDLRFWDVRDNRIISLIEFGNFDVIFHLAAQIDVGLSITQPRYDADINILGTINILEGASNAIRPPRLIFSSSAAVYGSAFYPDEMTARNPLSPYGLSKKCAEDYIQLHHNVESIILRYANVYGPRQGSLGEGGVVSVFSRCAANRKPLTIYGDGEQTRDFVYVKDVVDANLFASGLVLFAKERPVWNVGTGKPTSINALAKYFEPYPVDYAPPKRGEIRDSCLNVSSIGMEGWSAKTDLYRGLQETKRWFMDNT